VSSTVGTVGTEAPRAVSRKDKRGRWRRFTLLTVGALVVVFPIYWMLVTALSPQSELVGSALRLWPSDLEPSFVRAWNLLPFSTWYVNSVLIAVVAVVITVSINLLAGFVFAKYRFPGGPCCSC
jgi:ABC-type glycerol-3-phosphate transport system permease component